MILARPVKAVLLSTLLLAVAACGSNKDKAPQAGAAGAAKAGAAQPGAVQAKGAAPVVPEQDKADARAAAAAYLDQLKNADFRTMYAGASSGFKELGTEAQFVSMMERTKAKTGAVHTSHELTMETGADKRQMITYSVDYDNVRSNLRLSFLRAKDGKMQLVGVNQKDDVVKNANLKGKPEQHKGSAKKM
jgi:hypothetical protein